MDAFCVPDVSVLHNSWHLRPPCDIPSTGCPRPGRAGHPARGVYHGQHRYEGEGSGTMASSTGTRNRKLVASLSTEYADPIEPRARMSGVRVEGERGRVRRGKERDTREL